MGPIGSIWKWLETWARGHRSAIAWWCVVALAVFLLFLAAAHQWLPGYEARDVGTLWATFWASLLAGGLVAFVAGVVLYVWQKRREEKQAREETEIEIAVLEEVLWQTLEQRGSPLCQTARDTIPTQTHKAVALLEGKPLVRWRGTLPEHPLWERLDPFRFVYRSFLARADMFEDHVTIALLQTPEFGIHDHDPAFVVAKRSCIRMGVPEEEGVKVAFTAARSKTISTTWAMLQADAHASKAIEEFRQVVISLNSRRTILYHHLANREAARLWTGFAAPTETGEGASAANDGSDSVHDRSTPSAQ